MTFLCVGNPHTLSVLSTKLPAMKWALDAVAHHLPTHSQVGPQVGAVGVQHVCFSILSTKHCQLLTWRKKD